MESTEKPKKTTQLTVRITDSELGILEKIEKLIEKPRSFILQSLINEKGLQWLHEHLKKQKRRTEITMWLAEEAPLSAYDMPISANALAVLLDENSNFLPDKVWGWLQTKEGEREFELFGEAYAKHKKVDLPKDWGNKSYYPGLWEDFAREGSEEEKAEQYESAFYNEVYSAFITATEQGIDAKRDLHPFLFQDVRTSKNKDLLGPRKTQAERELEERNKVYDELGEREAKAKKQQAAKKSPKKRG